MAPLAFGRSAKGEGLGEGTSPSYLPGVLARIDNVEPSHMAYKRLPRDVGHLEEPEAYGETAAIADVLGGLETWDLNPVVHTVKGTSPGEPSLHRTLGHDALVRPCCPMELAVVSLPAPVDHGVSFVRIEIVVENESVLEFWV